MAKINLDPYLSFDGKCEEAIEFYKSIFGGELTKMRFGDVPGSTDEMKDKIMHGFLESDEIRLMASDAMDQTTNSSSAITLSLSGEDDQVLRSYFEKLSDGGNVTSPLKTEVWGDTFGMLTDKYGFDWMVNITTKK